MLSCFAIPELADVAPAAFEVGDIVCNLTDQIGRVVDVRQDGTLVLRQVGGSMKWLADPAKCRPVR